MRKFSKRFFTSSLLWGSSLFAVALACLHLYQFIDSGFRIEPLVKLTFCGIYSFIVFFFGSKSIPWILLIFGYCLELFADFTNYTSFLICILFLVFYKKAKLPVLILYVIDVVVVCTLHEKSLIHFIIHLINCALIFFGTDVSLKFYTKHFTIQEKKLELDEIERFILSQLANGSRQKEIDGLSENTVSKRLKKCREKNNCSSNSELLLKYLHEIQ